MRAPTAALAALLLFAGPLAGCLGDIRRCPRRRRPRRGPHEDPSDADGEPRPEDAPPLA